MQDSSRFLEAPRAALLWRKKGSFLEEVLAGKLITSYYWIHGSTFVSRFGTTEPNSSLCSNTSITVDRNGSGKPERWR